MKVIESILKPIEGYVKSINRNPQEGWYEMEIAIPKNWVFNGNNEINVDVISENEIGKLLNVIPKSQSVVIDDLVLFVQVVIRTNEKIAEKELEFKQQMEEMKKGLEKKASQFFKELDDLKENSFQKLNDNFENGITGAQKIKRKYTRTPKPTTTFTGTTS
jgi:hypothetical protein